MMMVPLNGVVIVSRPILFLLKRYGTRLKEKVEILFVMKFHRDVFDVIESVPAAAAASECRLTTGSRLRDEGDGPLAAVVPELQQQRKCLL